MGKTSKPLKILIDWELLGKEEITKLKEQGHDVIEKNYTEIDLIISRKAWRMTPDLLKYLPLAVKAARQAKYPKKKGEPDAD